MRLFSVFVPTRILALLICESLLIVGSFIVACYIHLPADPMAYLLYDGGMFGIAVMLVSILIGLYLNDLYSEVHVRSGIVLLLQIAPGMGMALVTQGLITYLDSSLRMSAGVMTYGCALATVTIFLWRYFYTSTYVLRVVGRDRLLLVGGSSVLVDIARHIEEHPEMGLEVAGYVDDVHPLDESLPGGKVLGRLAALREITEATSPARIVVGMTERRDRMPVVDLLELRFAGHLIEEAAAAYERVCGRVCIHELRPSQLIYTGELGPRRRTLLLQNLVNMLVAAAGLTVGSPIMALAALAVRFSSPGPVFYRQERVGLNNVPFTLYKLRSMRDGAEAATGAVWAAKNDPRVTRVGRVLRRLRIDEMPQFWNVLRGEMSIVGPRPERPEFVKALSEQIPYYRQRHCVRPGITGWAQINYKYGDTLEDTTTKLEYDLFYIKNMSFSLDGYVIAHTLKAMLLSPGAQ
jgi:sugar transferase (PEP-CTERM system associated)